MLLIATEDALSEAVALKLVKEAHPVLGDVRCMGRKGNVYLRQRVPEFCRTAKNCWVFILTDLDKINCPTVLVRSWLGDRPRPEKLVLRVAVREIEAWLLADRSGLSAFLGVAASKISHKPQDEIDPKAHLIDLAKSGRREVRYDICPQPGVRAPQGLGYNSRLCQFVDGTWSPDRAAKESDSLARARLAIATIIV